MSEKNRDNRKTITISGVDTELLEKQRVILSSALCGRRGDTAIVLSTKDEVDALEGIINMLDTWSDKKRNHKPI